MDAQNALISTIIQENGTITYVDTLTQLNVSVCSIEDFYQGCDQFLRFTRGGIEVWLLRWLLPFQIVFGIAGNSLNLAFLLSVGMPSRDMTLLLKAMAAMDISLLICNIPYFLSVIPAMYIHPYFRKFYYSAHVYFHTFTNIFTASATWLVLTISLERYIVIRSPFHARLQYSNTKTLKTIFYICIGAVFVSSFHFFEHNYDFSANNPLRPDAGLAKWCFRVFQYARLDPAPRFDFLGTNSHHIIGWAKFLAILIVVGVPLILVPVFNLAIFCVLRGRPKIVATRSFSAATSTDSEQPIRESCVLGSRHRHERKATQTIVAIVAVHILTDSPSAFPFVWEMLGRDAPIWIKWIVPSPDRIYVLRAIINSLHLTGKVLNFFLFCLLSEHFRNGVLGMLRKYCKTLQYYRPSFM